MKTLYLQKNYDGTCSIAVKNSFKDEVYNGADYVEVLGGIDRNITFDQLNKLVVKKFGCEKSVIQF